MTSAVCGPSTYAAGRAEEKKKKNYTYTGVILASCRHGVELGGKTWRKERTIGQFTSSK